VALFLSTYVNKVDRKGRVSVPARFRETLLGQSFSGIVVYRSLKLPAIECCGFDRIAQLSARLDQLNEYSEERDALSSVMADSQELAFDGEGRILLPQPFCAHAGIAENAAFVGLGATFQIWEPEGFARHQEEMRERARQRGMTLPPLAAALPSPREAPR